MGGASVEYHRKTVVERGDDYPGRALAYYASRGETPLVWGGSGAGRLGLAGTVTAEEYEAIYGPGGARHPVSGERLVSTRRPGLELVISAHKSVAELGVIGRAEDMHQIMDAERDATLGYLDRVTRQMGGRRGEAAVATATGGLIYAHTRHATSRAGDPCPHDHVLVANLVEMADQRGGWKAADTALWREHLHAATMVGRVAAARVAVELGYGIEADPGPSGKLGHWRIAGVPDEVMAVHSKRAAEIDAECARRGETSYQARGVAARTTRSAKEGPSEADLVDRWQGELLDMGWPVDRLAAAIDAAAQRSGPVRRLTLDAGPGDPVRHLGTGRRSGPQEGVLPPRCHRRRRPAPVRPGPGVLGGHGGPGAGRPRSHPAGRCGRRPPASPLLGVCPGPRDSHRRQPGPPGRPPRRPRHPQHRGGGGHQPRWRPAWAAGCPPSRRPPRWRSARRGGEPRSWWGWPGPARPPCSGWCQPPSKPPATR